MALLTVETVPAYVNAHLDKLGGNLAVGANLTGEEISGGNLNYAFRVKDADGGSVFVKQAPDFIKVFGPEAKLHRERMELEVAVYKEWESILGAEASARFLPKIFHFDVESMVFIMQDLATYELLDKQLFAGVVDNKVAATVGEFMGLTHGSTHCTKVSAERAAGLTKAFENAKLRDIQLEYVFTKAFRESDRATCFREDAAFLEEVEKLKSAYRGESKDNLALVHGDLHPGSVMACESLAKVIDPEFAIYGPPGLDLGSLLAGYALAGVFHVANRQASQFECVLAAMEKCWLSYVAAMESSGIARKVIDQISEDAVGFAACEIARTSLGFAGVRGTPIGDEALKAKAEEASLGLAHRCVMGRSGKGFALLLEELKNLGKSFVVDGA